MSRKRKCKSKSISNQKRSKLNADQDLQSNSRPLVILTELPTELLIKIFTYITEKNCFKNLSQTCQRFNELCAVDFTLRLNFECITKVELPIINRDYSKVIMEGTEIPEHLLDLLSSLNFETVSSLKITRAHTCKNKKSSGKGNNHCRIHARTYLKILKMFPNIKILELDAVRLSVILKSDIIDVDDLPDLQNLTFLKVRDVNESVYQCLWKATNLTKIDAKKITEATRGCRNFMNLLEQCRTNLKHLEADTFDMSKRFSMDALEYLYFDFSLRYSRLFDPDKNFNFWLFGSPILKNCTIKIFDIQISDILLNDLSFQSSMSMLVIEGCNKENVINQQHRLLKKFSFLEKLMWEGVIIWKK